MRHIWTILLLMMLVSGAVAVTQEIKGTVKVTNELGAGYSYPIKTSIDVIKGPPQGTVKFWTDKRNYTSGERVFAHVNFQFKNTTDCGFVTVEINNTKVIDNEWHCGRSVMGADWDMLAGWGNPTPGTAVRQ